jgi:lipopolysaccharide/colanic/teichoic acid biosynthesis glycosyltransferase
VVPGCLQLGPLDYFMGGTAKRLFDVAFSGAALLLLAPVLVGLAALVRVRLGRPVLFKQPRPGLDGMPFEMVKFRTMTDQRDESGRLRPDEERLTPFGRFLRATSADELPELWNVLKGEMSLVGPRPLLMQYLDRYSARQRRRHEVRPGITGWAQVNGRNALSWDEKFELDVWYVDNRSFLLDLRILLMTLLQVVRRQGISSAGHATMPEFMGSDAGGDKH